MTNTELERARELKHKLDVAWKQVGEFAANLTNMGFDVHLCCASEWFFDRWEKKLNRYVAPLTLDTVLETPFWYKKNIQEQKTTQDNVTWAIQELALHDDSTFREWTNKIRLVCKDVLNWMPSLSTERVDYIQVLETQWDSIFNEDV